MNKKILIASKIFFVCFLYNKKKRKKLKMSLRVNQYNPKSPNKNISFGAQIKINADKALYRGIRFISDKEIRTLEELAKTVGSKKDSISVEIGEGVLTPLKQTVFRHPIEKTYKMEAITSFNNVPSFHDLSPIKRVERPTNFHTLFCDGFEKETPFDVLKKWLLELKNLHR